MLAILNARRDLGLIFLLSLILAGLWMARLVNQMGLPTGDEPYYLLIAHSLWYDGDLDLANNFAAEDYRAYYPRLLYPYHESQGTRPPGLYSKHTPGTSLLILPGYLLAGWPGAALTMALTGVLLSTQLYLLAREAGGRRDVAFGVWAMLSLSNPVASYAPLIFPETPAALLTLYAFRWLRRWDEAGAGRRFLVGLGLAFLPWLHPRFLLLAGSLGLLWLWQSRREQCHWWLVLLPILVSGSLFVAYHLHLYGALRLNYADHGGSTDLEGIVVALFGLFLDQQWGLLIHAPVYLVAGVALIRLWLSPPDRADANRLWLVILPYFGLIVSYRYWWGEWCPPGRYLLAILPLLALPLARSLAVACDPPVAWRYTLGLALPGWLIMAAFVLHPALMYNHPTGASQLLLWLTGDSLLTGFFPSMFAASLLPWPIRVGLTVGWTGVVIALTLAGGHWLRR